MVLEIILSILELFADPIQHYVVAPIKRHVSYAFKFDSKLQGLQRQVEQLQRKKLRLQQSVDGATRNGREIYSDVSSWLTDADEDIREAEELIQRKDDAKKNKCFFGLCPDLKTRYQLSKNAGKKTLAIGDLCKREFAQVSFQPQLQQIVEPSLYSQEALPSRVSMLNQVMDALKDPNLNTIGVFGMGGVGKTTLAKEVLGKALQDKLFETAVMVPVSQAPEIRRIQGQIADFLGMKYSAEEIQGRASELYKRLENSKVLLILDDLWHKLDLNDVGIPSRGTSEGCKIMLTSRSGDLLSTEMQAQKLFPLEALKEEETLCLFQMSVAEAKDHQFHHIANEIARKCGGLPLLVDMVAKDLRNKESYWWNNMLNRLSVTGDGEIYEKVHSVLASSYENLTGEEMKQFFLLCALFGQSNIEIRYLLTHSMGLGLFKHIFTVEGARCRVLTMIDQLKAKSLLLEGDMAGYVKMHDVVRDTALSIASRVQHAFIGSPEAGFRDWPSRDCSRISLPYCNVSELPLQLDCPEVEAFLLFTEDRSLKIPDPFFEGMKKLKVADLRGMRLVPFPSSLGMLTTLQTLSLQNCKLDDMTALGELRQLEFLSFANSNIVELPRETESLTRLKLLDLQGCSDLLVVHESLFSKLCSLEELYMLNSFEGWNAKGNVSLEELENLGHLSTLEIHIPNPKMIPIGFKCFTQLKRYKISIGSSWIWNWNGEPEGSRVLKLEVEEGVHLEHGTEFLLRGAEYLFLDGVKGVDNLFYEGFPKLKHMHVTNDSEFEHLIKSTMPASCSVFPVLESLYLENLQRLETICRGQLGMGSFGELRVLNIYRCYKLSSLFSFSSIKCLQKLQELEVILCKNMEAVVGESNEDEGIELSQLSSLTLSRLPHLTGFCKIEEGTEQMGMLFNSEMKLETICRGQLGMGSFGELRVLKINHCNKLSSLFSFSSIKCLQKLQELEVESCENMEAVVGESNEDEGIELSQLSSLTLSYLPHLMGFCKIKEGTEQMGMLFNSEMVRFPHLTSLRVAGCGRLKNIFTASMVKCLMQLKKLEISDCESVTEIIQSKKMEEIEEGDSREAIVFPKLDHLSLGWLNKVKWFSSGYSIKFLSLRELSIEKCFHMRNFVGRDSSSESAEDYLFNEMVTFSNLENLDISSMDSIKHLWDEQHIADDSFSKLKSISILDCSNLAVVFPSEICTRFRSVETLSLSDCLGVEEIYQKMDLKEVNNPFSLQRLQIRGLRSLKHIWNKESAWNKGSFPTFQNLQSVEVEDCKNLKYVFPPSVGCGLPRLKSLQLKKCERLEVMIAKAIDDEGAINASFQFPHLKILKLENLREMRSLHEGHYNNTLECPNLTSLTVLHCSNISLEKVREHLENGKRFQNLESLEMVNSPISSKAVMSANQMHFSNKLRRITVRDCDSIQVVFDLEELSAVQVYTEQLLPKLEQLDLDNLPLLTQLCNKDPKGILEFNKLRVIKIHNCSRLEYALTCSTAPCLSQLQSLEVKNCEMMETFIVGEENVADKVTFKELQNVVLENMPKFSCIYSGSGHLESPSLKEITVRKCPNIKALLISRQVHSTNQAFPKLEKLLIDMKSVEGMMQYQAPTDLFSELKILKLGHCSAKATSHVLLFLSRLLNLDQLELHDSSFQELLNSELDEALTMPHIKSLRLKRLFDLNKIWWRASLFHSLETLEVFECDQLTNLMTPSTAKSMEQLKLLRIDSCEMLMEIVGDGCDQKTDEVTFTKLKTLELVGLRSLKAFSLTHYNFSFPCLDTVSLYNCPNLRIFCNGTVKTEILNHGHDECLDIFCINYWADNLNLATRHMYDQMVGFQNFDEIKLSAFPMLKKSWEAQFPTHFLSFLKRLEVDNCELFSNALPSRLVKHLTCLQVLIVEKCDSVERVIDLEGLNASEYGTKQMRGLMELHLIDLPRLKQVWSKDPQQILSFENLRTLKVDNCCSLTCIFNLSMASSLPNLEHVEVKNCSLVEHIIMISEEETVQQNQTILPSLRSLTLLHLPNLLRFCSTSGVLEIPSLITIEVTDCPNVQFFASTFSEGQHLSITTCSQPLSFSALLGNKIVIPRLQELTVEWKALKNQLFGDDRPEFLSKLKCIELTGFQGEEDANFVPNFLQPLLSLEKLCLSNSSIEEILFDNLTILKDKNHESLALLTKLKLSNLPKLKHLVRDDCQPIPLFENLVDLEVTECSSLKILVPFSVSFHNLTNLRVSNCDGLTTLLSASIARSLVQLRRMYVKNCKMMREIIAITSDGEDYEIRFSQLEYLGFDDLPGLKSFSSGNYDFHFPSLEEVMVIECPNMKNFAEKVSVTMKLKKVKTGRKEYEWEWEGSLNNTIQALYMQKDVEETAAIRSES